jgi:hypothetical protein
MKKYTFSYAERYAIWLHHQKRCWRCLEPLRLIETSVDHVVPEYLLGDEHTLSSIIEYYGLSSDFQINGFENWLPCHRHCNEAKGKSFNFAPGNDIVFRRLAERASIAERTVNSIKANVVKDKLLAKIFVALEEKKITMADLQSLVGDLGNGAFVPAASIAPKMIHLDNGYWLHEEDVAAEGPCQCGRESCVDRDDTVYCYWARALSNWVVRKRLYWKCYDEVVSCPRCGNSHRRGHVGKRDVCERPYKDQVEQHD